MRTQRTALVDSCESGSAISATPTWLVRRRPNPPAAQIFAAVARRPPFSPALRLILRVAALAVWDRLGPTPGWGGLPRPHRRRPRTPCSESGLAWHAAAVTSAGARASARPSSDSESLFGAAAWLRTPAPRRAKIPSAVSGDDAVKARLPKKWAYWHARLRQQGTRPCCCPGPAQRVAGERASLSGV